MRGKLTLVGLWNFKWLLLASQMMSYVVFSCLFLTLIGGLLSGTGTPDTGEFWFCIILYIPAKTSHANKKSTGLKPHYKNASLYFIQDSRAANFALQRPVFSSFSTNKLAIMPHNLHTVYSVGWDQLLIQFSRGDMNFTIENSGKKITTKKKWMISCSKRLLVQSLPE